MNRNLLIIVLSVLMQLELPAQTKWGLENYYYGGQPGGSLFVPKIFLECRNNWYTEVRYNYEAERTLSVFTGRSFSAGGDSGFFITPMLGLSAGGFRGISLATNAGMSWNNVFVSMESQYSIETVKGRNNFFFSWLESGYQFCRFLFGGVTLQYLREEGLDEWHPGLLAGVEIGKLSVPFYVFNPGKTCSYFVLGVNYEFQLRSKKNK
jgi:hypothetical protein